MQLLFIRTNQCHWIPTECRQIRRPKRHWTNNHHYFPFSIKEALLCFKILPQFYCLFIDKLPVPVAALYWHCGVVTVRLHFSKIWWICGEFHYFMISFIYEKSIWYIYDIWYIIYEKSIGGSVAELSACRTRNPVVPGSSPALATCWICSRSSRVQILGHACK